MGKDCINLNADALAEELGGWNDTECIIKAQQQIREQLNNAITLEAIEKRLKIWIRYYNCERLHAALGNKTPEEWRKEQQAAA